MVVSEQSVSFRGLSRFRIGITALVLGLAVCVVATWAVWSVYEIESAKHAASLIVAAFAGTIFFLFGMLAAMLYRANRRLAQSHERLRAIFSHSPAMIHFKDRRHAMVVANPATCALVDRSEAELLGKTDLEFEGVQAGTNERWAAEERVMTTGIAERTVYARESAQGQRHLQVVRFPVRDPDHHQIVGVGAVGLDITEQIEATRRLEELSKTLDLKVDERTQALSAANAALEVATRAAEAEAQAKANFLANMSHEVRTPLNAVIGMAHLALRTRLDVRQRSYLEKIQTSGQHLLEIVDEILDLSRIEAGKLELDRCEFSLESLLHTVSDLVAEPASAKGLELIVDIAPDTPDLLVGDSLRIRQVLANLASNAVKFTEHGEVVIRVDGKFLAERASAVRLRFEVRDSGIGIRHDDRARLFESFEQADITTARRYGGSGLGLAVCRHLVGLMGGDIGLSSLVGEGSAFYVELDLEVSAEPSRSRPRVPSADVRVLVVDDHPYARGLTAGVMRELGFEVDQVDSGHAALSRIRAADDAGLPYRLALIDSIMPGIDGLETARRVDSMMLRYARPRCVLMTSLGKEPSVLEDERTVIDAIVYKPASKSTLIEAVMLTLRGDLAIASSGGLRGPNRPDYAVSPHARILVVDDNDISRDLAVYLLLEAGISADVAPTGMRALELIETSAYDLILMDIRMPLMDGVETMRRIRADRRFANQRIVAMTANALHDDLEHYIEAGMDDCIVKPVDPDAFYATLRRWLPASDVHVQRVALAASSSMDLLSRCAQLDVGAGMAHVAGKPEVYRGLIERFAREYADIVEKIEQCLDAGRREKAMLHAHSLKGVAGIIGAKALSAASSSLEHLLLSGPGMEPGMEFKAATVIVGSMRSEMTPLIAALQAYLRGSLVDQENGPSTVRSVVGPKQPDSPGKEDRDPLERLTAIHVL